MLRPDQRIRRSYLLRRDCLLFELQRHSFEAAPVHLVEPLDESGGIVLLGYPCLTEDRIKIAVERIARAQDGSRAAQA